MSVDTAVVWFRDDLRVTDNPTLADAVETADRVLPVYVFDPQRRGPGRYGPTKHAPHRMRFRRESVQDLRGALRERGGDLLVREGDPASLIPELAATVGADAVYAQTKPATDELDTEHAVREALPEAIDFERRWTHTLYHINDLPTPYHAINDTFTPWRKDVERNTEVRSPRPAPTTLEVPAVEPGEVPSLAALGVEAPPTDDRGVLPFEGGETAGKQRLATYFWEGDHLREYKQTRNGLVGANYSSKFSPWLAAGCLSPRWIHREVNRYESERVSNKDTYWLLFELAWRDFFQFQFVKHGADFFTPTGIRDVDREWRQDRQQFQRWTAGETGIPFVDANMRELNQTGYMSNRGRQNVASFLVDVLGIDWRWGAAYFQSQLIDYDVASNWGNWAYQAGVGNDSRNNYFNVLSQADRYDGDGEYVTHWLPALSAVPPAQVHTPWELTADEQRQYGVELGIDYPRPMIDIEQRYDELYHERQ